MASKSFTTVKSTLKLLGNSSNCVSSSVRSLGVWSKHEKTVKSPHKSVEIPNWTLYDYVWQNLDKWPERTVSVCATTGRGYTYEQAFKLSNALAANFRKKFKIRDGDAVAVMLPNIPDYPLVAMGILEAGGVITTVNPIYTADEVQRQLLMSNAKLVITMPELYNVVKDALKKAKLDIKVIVVKTNEDPTPEGAVAFNELSEDVHIDKTCLREVRRTANDICFLPYSSGTTGLPKGVELSHRNLVANGLQISEPSIATTLETTATHQDSIMAVLPFFHIYGASVIMFHKMSEGCKIVTLSKFQPHTFIEALEKYKSDVLYAAPPLVLLLASHASAKQLQHLRTVINGAAPLATADIKKFFLNAERNLDFRQGYGLTETSPVVTMSEIGSGKYGAVGKPLPSTELMIVDAELNRQGPNEKGELLVKGPQVMRGYRDNPQANSESFTVDGWFKTGDLAGIDESGHVTIVDRLKELIKVKGFQVPPAELEGVLREHPAISDAAVIGVPHPTNGEAPKAFVVLKSGKIVEAKEISAFVRERVAPYKKVEDIVFLDGIPKSSAGKILRRELKDKYC